MPQTAGDGLQNLDRVLARLALAVATVEPRGDRKHNDDESVAECREEEEQAF